MTKEAVLQAFWGRFGLPAYEETTVPTEPEKREQFFASMQAAGIIRAEFPYITYQCVTDTYGHAVSLTASIWYRAPGWSGINAKAREISQYIGTTGKLIPCDGGSVWITRGNPFAQNMSEPGDDMVRRKLLSVVVTYNTNY